MYALVIDDSITETGTPRNLVRLVDGSKPLISPYITDDIYAECGWLPVVGTPPTFNPATQVMEHGDVMLVAGVPTRQYTVRPKTAEELAAEAVAIADEAERDQARQAITNLRAYDNLASPTNAQTVAVVKLLCRVCIALIRNTFRTS